MSASNLDRQSNATHDNSAPPESTKVITYLLLITSASEAKKKAKDRGSVSRRVELSAMEPWDTVKAQFLKEIDDALSPLQIDFNNYDISFKIPRVVSEPTRLFSDGDYDFMVRESTKGKTVSNVRVEIVQKKFVAKVSTVEVYMHAPRSTGTQILWSQPSRLGKENAAIEDSDEDESPKKKKKKAVSFLSDMLTLLMLRHRTRPRFFMQTSIETQTFATCRQGGHAHDLVAGLLTALSMTRVSILS